MYQVGDLIMYGSTGVCRVVEISEKDLLGNNEKQLLYSLKPLHQECMIFTPVGNEKVYMRPILSREEAEQLIDGIPFIQAEAYQSKVIRELTEHYEALIKTHNCEDLLMLTMSTFQKKKLMAQQKRKFGSVDEKFMKRAEELLFGELGAALGIPREQVQAYIEARIGSQGMEGKQAVCDESELMV